MNLKVLNEFLTCCGSVWLPAESIPLVWPCSGWSSRRGKGTETGITAHTWQVGWEHPAGVTGQSSRCTWLKGAEKSTTWNREHFTNSWISSTANPSTAQTSTCVYHLSHFRAHQEGGTNRPGESSQLSWCLPRYRSSLVQLCSLWGGYTRRSFSTQNLRLFFPKVFLQNYETTGPWARSSSSSKDWISESMQKSELGLFMSWLYVLLVSQSDSISPRHAENGRTILDEVSS